MGQEWVGGVVCQLIHCWEIGEHVKFDREDIPDHEKTTAAQNPPNPGVSTSIPGKSKAEWGRNCPGA